MPPVLARSGGTHRLQRGLDAGLRLQHLDLGGRADLDLRNTTGVTGRMLAATFIATPFVPVFFR